MEQKKPNEYHLVLLDRNDAGRIKGRIDMVYTIRPFKFLRFERRDLGTGEVKQILEGGIFGEDDAKELMLSLKKYLFRMTKSPLMGYPKFDWTLYPAFTKEDWNEIQRMRLIEDL